MNVYLFKLPQVIFWYRMSWYFQFVLKIYIVHWKDWIINYFDAISGIAIIRDIFDYDTTVNKNQYPNLTCLAY